MILKKTTVATCLVFIVSLFATDNRAAAQSHAPGGKFDNGIASANNLGSDRIIFPVQMIGDQDGQWDRNAWKTDAFYGNPLTCFGTVP